MYLLGRHYSGTEIIENGKNVSFIINPKTNCISASKNGTYYTYECKIGIDDALSFAKDMHWKMIPITSSTEFLRYNWIKYKNDIVFMAHIHQHRIDGKSDKCTESCNIVFHTIKRGYCFDNMHNECDKSLPCVKAVYDMDNNTLYVCYNLR
jgi:hypothetical protein